MSKRRQSNPKYRTPARYIENDNEIFFRCKIDKRKMITDAMGSMIKLDDGETLIETDADIDFNQNYDIQINGTSLSVDSVLSKVPKKNDYNEYRGNPVYVTRMIIK